MARKTDWGIIALGLGVAVMGAGATPFLPDGELVGLGLVAYGAGYI